MPSWERVRRVTHLPSQLILSSRRGIPVEDTAGSFAIDASQVDLRTGRPTDAQ